MSSNAVTARGSRFAAQLRGILLRGVAALRRHVGERRG